MSDSCKLCGLDLSVSRSWCPMAYQKKLCIQCLVRCSAVKPGITGNVFVRPIPLLYKPVELDIPTKKAAQ